MLKRVYPISNPSDACDAMHLTSGFHSPSDPAVWLGLGLHFHMEGNTADARMAYLNVIKLSPDSEHAAEAHLHDGVIHHSAGELDKVLPPLPPPSPRPGQTLLKI
jgi:hypothetical protein